VFKPILVVQIQIANNFLQNNFSDVSLTIQLTITKNKYEQQKFL